MFRFGGLALCVAILLCVVPLSLAQDEDVSLLITEVYPNPPGEETAREWIELMNTGTAVIDLSDIKVGDEESMGEKEGMLRFPKGAYLEPAQVIVIAQTAVGFRALFGSNPDYEIQDSDPAVPDMRRYALWALGDFALANDGDEVLIVNANNRIIESLNYGDQPTFFSPAIQQPFEGQSIARIPATCDTDSAADWQTVDVPTPGQVNVEGECELPAPLEEVFMPIGMVQSRTLASPFENEIVTVRGVVTGIYEDRNANGITFYTAFIQDEVGQEDGDPQTSDGVALFLGRKRPSFHRGDLLHVTGQVTEFFGFTELDDDDLQIEVVAEEMSLPEPIQLDIPEDAAAREVYFEALEGMRVAMAETAVVVGPTFSGCGFTVVSEDAGYDRVLRQQYEDDVRAILPILHESDVDCGTFPNVKQGDFVEGVVGPLIYHFDQFKVVQQAADGLHVTAVSMLVPSDFPLLEENQFSIVTFNMENYFDTLDNTGSSAEPKPSVEELTLKQRKLAYAISHTVACPTILAVQEVEKAELLHHLADLVVDDCGFLYEVTHAESADSRGIDVAFMTNPNHISIDTFVLQQTCSTVETTVEDLSISCPDGQFPLFSRPPLLIELQVNGQEIIMFNNHFKSKRGGELETALWRKAQAAYLAGLVDVLLAQNESAHVIVLGDFNDYELSPTLRTLTENGRLTNVLSQIPQAERYSFNFGGVSQLIDGILVSPAVDDMVDSVQILHTNADFPDSLATDDSAANITFRATDHDLPIVLFSILPETPPAVPTETAVPLPTPTPQPSLPARETDLSFVQLGIVALFAGLMSFGFIWQKYRKRP